MQTFLRRYLALTVSVAVAVTAVQALLVALVLSAYHAATNLRGSEVALAAHTIIVEDELKAGRAWPAIEKNIQDRLSALSPEAETAVYDESGQLLMRTTGRIENIPPSLSEEDRQSIGETLAPFLGNDRLGVAAVATRRVVAGRPLYLVRINWSLRHAVPSLLQLGLGALLLPMLLLGLLGAAAIVRLTGRQVSKVDRVLRMMAGGDLSARMSLPVDEDTAGVVLSFNRMAEKVERTVEKLRRSDESRRQLLADVTHELNTPLTSVLGYLETLCMEDLPLSEERRRSLLGIAYEEAVNLRALIEDLTTLSRLDAEGLRLERSPLSLGPVVEKVVRRMSQLAEQRGVPLETELAAGVEVSGDAQRIDQVVRNLVENALRHTSPPGGVKVIVRRDGQLAVIEVRDRGTGIPPEDLQRLGQRFLRVDKSRARHTGGRGLGLAITIGLVETHGGKVHFESVQGSGTTVRVTLPLLSQERVATSSQIAVTAKHAQLPAAVELTPKTGKHAQLPAAVELTAKAAIPSVIAEPGKATAEAAEAATKKAGPAPSTAKIESGRRAPAAPSAKGAASRTKPSRSRKKH